MSGPNFTPSAEVAEMNRIQYELEYTEGISQRMRVPETLMVASDKQTGPLTLDQPLPIHTALMQVPERIVVAGDDGDPQFSHPRDLDLIQSVSSVDLINMKTPPRVLTLSEQPLDSLEMEQHSSQGKLSQTVRVLQTTFASENTPARSTSQLRGDLSIIPSPSAPPVRLCPPLSSPEDAGVNLFTAAGFLSYVQSTTRRAYQQVLEVLDNSHHLALDANTDEMGLLDASSLRRQIVKLNRRLQLLEEENKERSKREMFMYSATVAFWLINTWIWLRR
uniref:Mitochondrial fission factor n=1 Tax=Takifugu rubripes TaxID=31033 RepID=A0A3B5KID3_TAKRU